MYKEKHIRSIFKTISWRITATITTVTLVWIFTGQIETAIAVGSIEVFLKMLFYYLHERGWEKFKFGRVEVEPFLIWFTGLPDSGKTTLADLLYERLKEEDCKLERLDGTNIREIFPKTGFSREERNKHIERIGHLSSLLIKNNITVVASFISPYKESRHFVRSICKNFVEIYINTPLDECEKRDSKGLYSKARRGELKMLTGVDDPYEEPENADLSFNNAEQKNSLIVNEIVSFLKKKKYIIR
jgi:adenylylsulfate kinase